MTLHVLKFLKPHQITENTTALNTLKSALFRQLAQHIYADAQNLKSYIQVSNKADQK